MLGKIWGFVGFAALMSVYSQNEWFEHKAEIFLEVFKLDELNLARVK